MSIFKHNEDEEDDLHESINLDVEFQILPLLIVAFILWFF